MFKEIVGYSKKFEYPYLSKNKSNTKIYIPLFIEKQKNKKYISYIKSKLKTFVYKK